VKLIIATLLALAMPAVCGCAYSAPQESRDTGSTQRTAGKSYPNMPSIAPIGEKIGTYMDVPASAVGPAVDPVKGYRLEDLGNGLYMVTDNTYAEYIVREQSGEKLPS
jgi:hypothetical protein